MSAVLRTTDICHGVLQVRLVPTGDLAAPGPTSSALARSVSGNDNPSTLASGGSWPTRWEFT